MGEVINFEGKNTVSLRSAIDHNGTTYTALTMREPRVKDALAARKMGGSDAEIETRIFANLCDVPPAVVEELTMRDYQRLQAVYRDFLS